MDTFVGFPASHIAVHRLYHDLAVESLIRYISGEQYDFDSVATLSLGYDGRFDDRHVDG